MQRADGIRLRGRAGFSSLLISTIVSVQKSLLSRPALFEFQKASRSPTPSDSPI